MKREAKAVRALFGELMRAPLLNFPQPRQKLDAPDRQGVYVICGPRGRVLHVGSTPRARGGIAQRLRSHMAANSSFVKGHLAGDGGALRNRHRFRCLVVENPRQRALLEAYATGRLCPAHLGLGSSAS
ncbi:MAG: hypothetical protein OXH59_01390 [Rhodospirillaceae bacterium]|nr:hypothetical protein [Rhodospirillaceae bacterium]